MEKLRLRKVKNKPMSELGQLYCLFFFMLYQLFSSFVILPGFPEFPPQFVGTGALLLDIVVKYTNSFRNIATTLSLVRIYSLLL